MNEMSDEMQEQVTRELAGDVERMRRLIMERPYTQKFSPLQYQELEQLVYVTEQIRMKLRLLGAPRIN